MQSKTSYRGLKNFIFDTSIASTKEEQDERVMKERRRIQLKFANPKLSDYDRRKYIFKLMYIFLLGYDVDFGFVEAAQLAASSSKQNKLAGYSFLSIMCSANTDFVSMLVATLAEDISGDAMRACLALNTIAVLASPVMTEALAMPVFNLLVSGKREDGQQIKTIVRKKAALAFLALYRADPTSVPLSEDDASQLVQLLNVRNVGLLTSLLALFHELVRHPPTANMIPLVVQYRTRIVHLLGKIRRNEVAQDHKYLNTVPCPWLQIKLLRLLRLLPPPKPQTDPEDYQQLVKCLASIFLSIDMAVDDSSKLRTRRTHIATIRFAIFREALSIAIHMHIDSGYLVGGNATIGDDEAAAEAALEAQEPAQEEETMRRRASSRARLDARRRVLADPKMSTLGRIGAAVDSMNANFRYVGLQCLAELAADDRLTTPLQAFIPLITPIIAREDDISVRLRALYLLYRVVSDEASANMVIPPCLEMLRAGMPGPVAEALALVVALLADRYTTRKQDYVDTIITLVSAAGQHAAIDVAFRMCAVVDASDAEVQTFAAQKAVSLLRTRSPQPVLVRVATHILGQHGHLLDMEPGEVLQLLVDAVGRYIGEPTVFAASVTNIAYYVASLSQRPEFASCLQTYTAMLEVHTAHYDCEVQDTVLRLLRLTKAPARVFSTVFARLPVPEVKQESGAERRLAKQLSESEKDVIPVAPEPSGHSERAPGLMLGSASGLLAEVPFLEVGVKTGFREQGADRLVTNTVYVGNKTQVNLVVDTISISGIARGTVPREFPAKKQTVIELNSDFDSMLAVAETTCVSSDPAVVGAQILERAPSLRIYSKRFGVDLNMVLPMTIAHSFVPIPQSVVQRFDNAQFFSTSWHSVLQNTAARGVIASIPARAVPQAVIVQNLLHDAGNVVFLSGAVSKPNVLPFMAAGRPQQPGAQPTMALGQISFGETTYTVAVRVGLGMMAPAFLQAMVLALHCAAQLAPQPCWYSLEGKEESHSNVTPSLLSDLLGPAESAPQPAAPAPAPAAAPKQTDLLDLLGTLTPAPAPAAPAAAPTPFDLLQPTQPQPVPQQASYDPFAALSVPMQPAAPAAAPAPATDPVQPAAPLDLNALFGL